MSRIVILDRGATGWVSAKLVAVLATGLLLAGCDSTRTETDVVWAVNLGGPAYEGVDGTKYAAEESVSGGEVGQIDDVLGSHDEFLYQSYREGDITIAHPIANGIYDVTFHFAEPDEVDPGDRVFDVLVEGHRVIEDLDVMLARDGKLLSALTVTVANLSVADGELHIDFDAKVRRPLLSALVVRNKNRPERSWELAWSDEFDKSGVPDPQRWTIEEWPPRVVNSEDQAYTARTRNVRVEGGNLIIEAHKEDHQGAAYTSGRVQSSGKGDFLYGRVEVRARLPSGKGTWAAIWMLPSDPFTYATTCVDDEDWQGSKTCDAWPNSGEIDIMEHVGYMMGHIHGTVHNRAYYFVNWQQRKGRILVDDVDEVFHVYALEWTPERIDIFVDDALFFTYTDENAGWESWPYDQPFHLIMNVAIGGDWGRSGGGIDDEIFPQRMMVDYVRVYAPASGKSSLADGDKQHRCR